MSHLDDGTVQAFLDDELPTGERAAAAEHLLACERCRALREELTRARSLFSEAVASLDVRPPARAPRVARKGGGVGAGSFVKAAGLVLLLAAAASAAVPGTPVHRWIVSVVEPAAEEPAPEVAEPSAPVVAPAPAPAPAGVSMIPVGDGVEVVVAGSDGTVIRLTETDGERLAVSAVGAERDPVFRTASGRIEVRDAVGGEVVIEIPRSLREARVVVDGELYAEKTGGELRIRVPGEAAGGATLWR